MKAANRQEGYSLVEVMAVLAITVVGLLALINLQVGTLKGLTASRSMMDGVNLAEHFLETLKSEAIPWNTDSATMVSQTTRFPHLRLAGSPATEGGGSGWVRAYISDDAGSDKRVGALGNDSDWDSGVLNEVPAGVNQRYCVHYRLTWVIPEYLLRADVRVLWMRDDSDLTLYDECQIGMETDLANVSSVTLPGTIMRNVFTN